MNIFSIYFEKIKKFLIDLEKDKQIKLSDNLNKLTIELPPKDLQGDISCNAALVLSKINNKKPKDIAILLKTNLIKKFPEFKNIFIAEPGFLNIEFNEDFWQKFLNDLLNLKEKYGSNSSKKNKYNVEFVSANPTGPLHVGHCRGAILGDVIAKLLIFNGNAVTKEYYVNDLGKQIKNFTLSVYYRIIEILHNKEFPKNRDDLYPGENVVGIAKKIIDKKLISEFNSFENIYEQLKEISVKESLELIKIKDSFFSESLSEEETKSIMSEMYKNHGILIDPHTAVGIGVAKKISLEGNTVVLATAHPSKFSDVVMEATGIKPELPENLKNILVEKENYDKLPKDLEKVKNYIIERT